MLSRLRLRLTFLYILAAVGLVLLIGISSYSLVRYYFQKETDQALLYKMATQFRKYGLALPAELAQAEESWQGSKAQALTATVPTSLPSPAPATRQAGSQYVKPPGDNGGEEIESETEGTQGLTHGSTPENPLPLPTPAGNDSESSADDRYDSELASIYVLPIDASGQVIRETNQVPPPFTQDQAARQAALAQGQDLRTVSLGNGTRVRLLTYRLDSSAGPFFLQLGRTLVDQDRVLKQFTIGLLFLGALSSVLLGLGSWWLAGRTLGPAQKAWDQQQAFVSNASHELRTPLTLIRASAEVGLRENPDVGQQALFQDIVGEADYMNRLVEDLLLLSRLDSHRLRLNREAVVLEELIAETSRQAEKLASEKGIKLETGKVEGTVWGDRTRLRQVLLILLDNAMRFTPAGGSISIESLSLRKTCQLIVSDNGSGIAPEHLAHIFERFYQANPTGEALARNNGLGLSIAKGVIEALGGEIHVQSQVGEGTRIVVELPAVP